MDSKNGKNKKYFFGYNGCKIVVVSSCRNRMPSTPRFISSMDLPKAMQD